MFEEYYGLQITEDEIGYIVLYIQAAIERKKHTAESNDDLIERLLLENYNRYYHLAYSYVHNPDDASDIVQNGAYLAIKNSASLRQPEYAATWIYRIMLNEIFHHLKRPDTISYEDSLIAEGKPDQYQTSILELRSILCPRRIRRSWNFGISRT